MIQESQSDEHGLTECASNIVVNDAHLKTGVRQRLIVGRRLLGSGEDEANHDGLD